MDTITLKNGIEITDNRHIQCGVTIKNVSFKYFELLYINTLKPAILKPAIYCVQRPIWMKDSDELIEFASELETLKETLIEANQFLNRNNG